jgi:hypothetical protein
MDTGEIDYRRADPVPSDFDARIKVAQDNLCDGTVARNGVPPEIVNTKERPPNAVSCQVLFPARLVRKNATVGEPIVKNDIYSIRLEHGFIADLIEDKMSFRRMMNGRNAFRKVGEVAVLAHAFEFASSSDAAAGAAARFANLSSLHEVKVVYFSPDVEARQTLNFNNIVLQEGRKYDGRPVGIQVVVLELDRMSGPMKSLLKTLAALGQDSGSLPSGPVAAALLDLGTSLISQENDDVMFDYRFVLDPSAPGNRVASAPFEAGRYVLRRTHERRQMQHWDGLVLDHNTGQLMQWSAGGQEHAEQKTRGRKAAAQNSTSPRKYIPFEQDTYFTVNIVKHAPGSEFFYAPQTFKQLGDELAEEADRRDASLETITTRAREALLATRKARWADDLGGTWRGAAARYFGYAGKWVKPGVRPDGTRCKASNSGAHAAAMALFEANSAVADFLSLYTAAGKDKDHEKAAVLSLEDKRRMLSSLASFFLPAPDGSKLVEQDLIDPSAFETKFVVPGPVPLQQAAKEAAERNWATKSCEELKALGLAEADPPEPVGTR